MDPVETGGDQGCPGAGPGAGKRPLKALGLFVVFLVPFFFAQFCSHYVPWRFVTGYVQQRYPAAADVPFSISPDACYMLGVAKQMEREGALRLRWIDLDNAPEGRAFHWAAWNPWWIRLMHQLGRYVAGAENAWLWAQQYAGVMQALLFAAAVIVAGAKVLPWRLLALVLGVVAVSPMLVLDFGFSVPDHHGWIAIACAGMLGSLFFACVLRPDRRHFFLMLSACFAGFGLWISASTQFLIAIFGWAGAGLWIFFRNEQERFPWSMWTTTAAVVSWAFYLFQYFPDLPLGRLEMNHPMYGIGWLFAGAALVGWERVRERVTKGRVLAASLMSLLAVVPLAVCILAPPTMHVLHDPVIWRVHQSIAEFLPVFKHGPGSLDNWAMLGLLPVLPVIAAAYCGFAWRGDKRRNIAPLVLILPASAGLIFVALLQERWTSVAVISTLLLGVAMWGSVAGGRWMKRLVGMVLLGTGLLGFVVATRGYPEAFLKDVARGHVALCQAADVIQRERGDACWLVSTTINVASVTWGRRLPTVYSLYWENSVGMIAGLKIWMASEEDARKMLEGRGITHLLVATETASVRQAYLHWTGEASMEATPCLLTLLAQPRIGSLPDWLEAVDLSGNPELQQTGWRLFRVRK